MKRLLTILFSLTIILAPISHAQSQNSKQLPKTIERFDNIYKIDESTRRTNCAEFDKRNVLKSIITMFSNYRVIASDVALYIDDSNNKGGDQFASGWVQATAPKFTARAEVWNKGELEVGGTNSRNKGDTAYATSYACVYIDNNRYPRIFYSWGW